MTTPRKSPAKPKTAPKADAPATTPCQMVTMSNNGGAFKASNLVPVEFLDAYVADARTRWDDVSVDPEVVAYTGEVVRPAHI